MCTPRLWHQRPIGGGSSPCFPALERHRDDTVWPLQASNLHIGRCPVKSRQVSHQHRGGQAPAHTVTSGLAPSKMAQGQGREAQQVFPAWVSTTEDVAKHHGVDVTTGLTASQVAEKRAQHGYNELEKEPGKSLFALVLEQFDDMLVKAST